MELRRFKDEIDRICSESGVARLSVFGSVARGSDRDDSDVDLIVEFKEPAGLVKLLKLEKSFEDVFGRKVDLGTKASLHPLLRSAVTRDLMVLYED